MICEQPNRHSWSARAIGIIALTMLTTGGLAAEEPANGLLPGEEIPEPCTDEDARAACVGIAPEEGEVQSRGELLPPLVSFRLRNSGHGNCLRPVSVAENARVVLGGCSGNASYWTPINGKRWSSIKGTFGADWEYMLRNNHTHFCLNRTEAGELVQTPCSDTGNGTGLSRPYVNFVPSPVTFGGEYVYVVGGCLTATSDTTAKTTSGQCTNTSIRRWHRAPL
jgi:hypothetical protein